MIERVAYSLHVSERSLLEVTGESAVYEKLLRMSLKRKGLF